MSARRCVAVWDQHWSTFGGGEQVAGAIAHALAERHDVTVLSPDPLDLAMANERLGLDLSACDHRHVINDLDASAASGDFDVFVNCTYLSRATNQSPVGWYYVHFPQIPPSRRDALRHWFGLAGSTAVSLAPRVPQRLEHVRAGFTRRVEDSSFVGSYERFFANSQFTSRWVERLWGVRADVLYPPVPDVVGLDDKRPTILNVGRFFEPRSGHCKKQLELVVAFDSLGDREWTLALAGGCDGPNRDYLLAVRRASLGKSIEVHVNAKRDLVDRLLSESAIYWHASGFGEDPERHPERLEHFGIAVVEAMAAGAVPLVFAAGGPLEVVRDGRDGFHWTSLDQLVRLTRQLIDDDGLRRRLSRSAQRRASEFSSARFEVAIAKTLT